MNIPEGWKLVPEHWTEEIAEAMADAFSANCSKEVIDNWLHLRPMYEAVLAAAPTPPAQENEPVAYMDVHDNWDLYKNKPEQIDVIPLYTRPDNSELWKAAEEALEALETMSAIGSSFGYEKRIENLRAALEGK